MYTKLISLFFYMWCAYRAAHAHTPMTTLFFCSHQPGFYDIDHTHDLGYGGKIAVSTLDVQDIQLEDAAFESTVERNGHTLQRKHCHVLEDFEDCPAVTRLAQHLETRFARTLTCTARKFPQRGGFTFQGNPHKTLLLVHLGPTVQFHLQAFLNTRPQGPRTALPLHHGQLVVFNQQATGWNWRKHKTYTFRHALERVDGVPRFVVSNAVLAKRRIKDQHQRRKGYKKRKLNPCGRNLFDFAERVDVELQVLTEACEQPSDLRAARRRTMFDTTLKHLQTTFPELYRTHDQLGHIILRAEIHDQLHAEVARNLDKILGPSVHTHTTRIQALVRGFLWRNTYKNAHKLKRVSQMFT